MAVSRVTEPVTASSRLISGTFVARMTPQGRGLEKSFCHVFGLLHMNYAHYGDVQ